jgi:hypothetical protein
MGRNTKLHTIACALVVAWIVAAGPVRAQESASRTLVAADKEPNIVFILVDNVGWENFGVHCRMNDLGLAVHSYMGLHPEKPLVSFLGLVLLGIALLLSVLGRRGRVQDSCVHDRAGGDGALPGLASAD